jgi:hypothetical protein
MDDSIIRIHVAALQQLVMYRRTNIACKSGASKGDLGPISNHASFLDELPSTVKALNDGWLATYQISTVVVRALSRGSTPNAHKGQPIRHPFYH